MLSEQTVRELNQLFGLAQMTLSRKTRYRWSCPLEAHDLGDFRVVPLTSSRALASEGWNMQSCVTSYDAKCALGFYQLFSIRDLRGDRIATLGLTYRDSGWTVDQCLGQGNAEVMNKTVEWIHDNGQHESMDEFTDLHYVALEVVRLLKSNQRGAAF
jgi:hypothetical protein